MPEKAFLLILPFDAWIETIAIFVNLLQYFLSGCRKSFYFAVDIFLFLKSEL